MTEERKVAQMAKFDGVKLYDVLVSYGVTNPLKCYSVDSDAVTEAVNARAVEKGLDAETFSAEFLKDCEAAGAVGTEPKEETVEEAPEAEDVLKGDEHRHEITESTRETSHSQSDTPAGAESDADESEDAPE